MTPVKIAITGATGLVGSHVAAEAARRGFTVAALVRPTSDTRFLDSMGVVKVTGDIHDKAALNKLCKDARFVVNCAARVGDWGKLADFRRDNVDALGLLLDAASRAGVQRIVHVSSLGVYEPRDHFGTDETVLPALKSLDAYTRSKTEGEILLLAYAAAASGVFEARYGARAVMLPYARQVLRGSELAPRDHLSEAVILRPGFVYGERDRTVVPKLANALRAGKFAYFGPGTQALNSIYAGNIAKAVFLAMEKDDAAGHAFNLTDGVNPTKREFVEFIAGRLGVGIPRASIPLSVAWPLATVVHEVSRMAGVKSAPFINKARYKFLGLHLDFSINKARARLGYDPDTDWRSNLSRVI